MKTFTRLVKFLLPSWRWLTLAVLLGSLTIASTMALMATSAYLISAAALMPSIAELQVAIVGVRFFGIARGVFRYLERLSSHETTFRLLEGLRTWFYVRLERLAPAGLERERSGDILNRIVADIQNLENFYLRVLAPPLVAIVISLGSGIFLAFFNWRLACILLIFLLLTGVGLTWWSYRAGEKPSLLLVESKAKFRSELVEGLQGLPDLLVFDGLNEKFRNIFELQDNLQKTERKMIGTSALVNGSFQLFSGLGTWFILIAGILLVAAGNLPGITLAVVVLSSMASFEAVQNLPVAAQTLRGNLQSARRLFTLVDQEPAVSDSLPCRQDAPAGDLSLKNIHFQYPGKSDTALKGIHIDLPPGKHLAIVGASGSGKSTLLSLLLRFYEPTSGEYSFNTRDVHEYHQDVVRERFSLMPHHGYLFNTTLRENLLVANPSASESDLQHALEQSCLQEFVNGLPEGLETLVGERGRQLSGGERQRIGVARLLLKEAGIFMLDEATAHLDIALEARVISNLQSCLEKRTVIWVSHRLVGMEWMDEIIVLNKGSIEERGRHADLIRKEGLYSRMWKAHNQLQAGASLPES